MTSKNVERYLDSIGKQIVKDAKIFLNKAKGGTKLANTIKYKVVAIGTLSNPDFSLVVSMASYGQFVDEGVSGFKKIQEYKTWDGRTIASNFQFGSGSSLVSKAKGGMSGIMSKWVKKKGFQWRDKQTGKFMSYKSMGYLIARSIYSKGIKGVAFYQRPLQLALPKFGVELASALIDDLRLEIKQINKNIN